MWLVVRACQWLIVPDAGGMTGTEDEPKIIPSFLQKSVEIGIHHVINANASTPV